MKIVVIGSSTGGPRILFDIFSNMPGLPVALIIIQHMPLTTTSRFSKRMSQLCTFETIVPKGGEVIKPGCLYIAPGDSHLVLRNNEEILLDSSEKVHFVRPSVDVTFFSLKQDMKHQFIGIILSGMGTDGAEGIAYLKSIGGTAIIQDPESCTIKSMPESALRVAKIDLILTPAEIRNYLLSQK